MDNNELDLFENTALVGTTKVAVIIGRFNPPTIGHYKLIGEAIKSIKTLNATKNLDLDISPVVLIIGDDTKHKQLLTDLESADESAKAEALTRLMKSPLSPSDIIYTMQNSEKLQIVKKNFYFSSASLPQGLSKIRAAGLEPIAIISGGDRAKKSGEAKSDYMRILDNYFKDNDGNNIKHYEIIINRAEDTTTSKDQKAKFINQVLDKAKVSKSSIADTDASGSMARRAVELGYEEEFAKITGLENKPALAKKIFNKISKSLKA